MLNDYVVLNERYNKIQEKTESLTKRLDKIISVAVNQRPQLSDAEIKLKDEMNKETTRIVWYREQLDQIKQKRRYQQEQYRKSSLQSREIPGLDFDNDSFNQIKNIKKMISSQ